jgi:hypothetical protein
MANVTASSADDWQFGIVLTYKNFAAMDSLGARTNAITLKHYGSDAVRTATNDARAKRLKALEDENRRLKRLVADQALTLQILKDVLGKER